MKREFIDIDVREALERRFDFIFGEFENIIISFSGGKDSGLLLNMLLDYRARRAPERRICVFHQDFEAQYNLTTEYIERTFRRLESIPGVELYWVCLPMATRTALSNYEMYWYPWDDKKREIWVRPMPEHPYVVNLENNPISTYRYRMHQEDLAKQFGRWYRLEHDDKPTVTLLGIRADESLSRYSGFLNRKYGYKGECYITRQFKNSYAASPMYDWTVGDVWHANYLYNFDYNRLYDLYYKAGLRPTQMRVASPFNDYAKESLNIYRVIDPEMWAKLVGRVRGANFGAIYGKTKALGYRNLTLPEGHTWKSYTHFLLATLPSKLRNNYIAKFKTSIKFWHHTGGGLETDTISELRRHGYDIELNGVSNYTVLRHQRVIFKGAIPDHTDDIKSSKDIPSWKRMCYCILKNDHNCRFMGFGLTREQQANVDLLRIKYGSFTEKEKSTRSERKKKPE